MTSYRRDSSLFGVSLSAFSRRVAIGVCSAFRLLSLSAFRVVAVTVGVIHHHQKIPTLNQLIVCREASKDTGRYHLRVNSFFTVSIRFIVRCFNPTSQVEDFLPFFEDFVTYVTLNRIIIINCTAFPIRLELVFSVSFRLYL